MLNVQRCRVSKNHHLDNGWAEEKETRALIPEDLDELFFHHLTQS
jgi:hypothetical protein